MIARILFPDSSLIDKCTHVDSTHGFNSVLVYLKDFSWRQRRLLVSFICVCKRDSTVSLYISNQSHLLDRCARLRGEGTGF